MDLGVHLPVLTWNDSERETPSLIAYVETARRLGFTGVSVNDHLQHRRPWLDAPTALASVVSATGDMTLATTIALALPGVAIIAWEAIRAPARRSLPNA